MNAVIAGDVDFYFDTPTTIAPMVKSGRLVALAVTSTKRLDDLPDVPTLRESGLPKFDVTTWFGLVAPAGTPRDRIDFLAKHLTTVLRQAPVVAALRNGGFEIETLSPDDFAQKIAAESARWGATIREAGIKLD
jgi:tripartite-type tricarboxylate transporter receptor subunit TctC